MMEVATSVAIYLGIPFLLGMLIRLILESMKGTEWYIKKFVPKIGPLANSFTTYNHSNVYV